MRLGGTMQIGEGEKGGGEGRGRHLRGGLLFSLFFNIYFLFTWLC